MTLEDLLAYQFKNKKLLEQALTHSSYSYENKIHVLKNNERLEFLGDAVIEFCVSSYLYETFTKMPEGDLTRFRAKIVCESSLAKVARHFQLDKFLKIGKGEELTGGRERDSILSDAFEAMIGALYLDGGSVFVLKFVTDALGPMIEELKTSYHVLDYKTALQEFIQRRSSTPLIYKIVEEKGPDHNKTFLAEVSHEKKKLGQGIGKTKKEAEQLAASRALEKIKK